MKNYVLFVVCLLFTANVFAQEDDYYPIKKSRYLGIEGIYNCTLLDLDVNNYRDGGGLSFSGFGDITSRRNPFVLQWGVEGLFAASSRHGNYYDQRFDREVSGLTNAALGLNGLLRLEYTGFPIHPYIDGFVGGRLFQSGYFTEEFDEYEGRYEDTWSGMSSTATGKLAYGVGAGVLIPVSNRVDINFRTAYTHTGPIRYINMNDFIDDATGRINPSASSDYDMLSFHLGVRIRLGDKSERVREKKERRQRRKDCECADCPTRRNRPIIDILFNDWGGSTICTPRPNECSTDDRPSRSRPRKNSRNNDDDTNDGDIRNNEPDNPNGCEPNYGSSQPNSRQSNTKPRQARQQDDN